MLKDALHGLGIAARTITEIRQKDGVAVYRVAGDGISGILKTYANEADRREIENYRILQSLGIPTLKIIANTQSALLMEDVSKSETLRLGRREDMDNPGVAACLARWYRELHGRGKPYAARHGQSLYDETDAITLENMRTIAGITGTAQIPVWEILFENFHAVGAKIASVERTLAYNDFYYTNMIVQKDLSAAFMFDYNLLGKGYVYADLRNVTSSLGEEAGAAFLREYGAFDVNEVLFDDVASVLTTLHFACQKNSFPGWGEAELEKVKNGSLERAVRRLLAD